MLTYHCMERVSVVYQPFIVRLLYSTVFLMVAKVFYFFLFPLMNEIYSSSLSILTVHSSSVLPASIPISVFSAVLFTSSQTVK